ASPASAAPPAAAPPSAPRASAAPPSAPRASVPRASAYPASASSFATEELPLPPDAPSRPQHKSGATPRPAPAPAAARTAPPRSPDLSGSLGVLDLMELSQAFSMASKTGQLFLDCPRGEGCIYFELGRVIHATFREVGGRAAFSEILQATQRD